MILLGLISVLLVVVFMLGEQAGRESSKRSDFDVKVSNAEAQLKNVKTERAVHTTPYWMYFVLVVLLAGGSVVSLRRCEDHRIERRWDW
jgi:hypothetical protein